MGLEGWSIIMVYGGSDGIEGLEVRLYEELKGCKED